MHMIYIMHECVCYKMTIWRLLHDIIYIMHECVCYKMTSMEITTCI